MKWTPIIVCSGWAMLFVLDCIGGGARRAIPIWVWSFCAATLICAAVYALYQ